MIKLFRQLSDQSEYGPRLAPAADSPPSGMTSSAPRPRNPLRRLANSLKSHTRPTVVRRRQLITADPCRTNIEHLVFRSDPAAAGGQHRRHRCRCGRRTPPGALGLS
ncbi:hypothetical protein FJT64_016237 [Amphibalanus amphitrite]|uniref:Uncharacterized protein n=1 Tax=Amphibalanus amphitrite TaxID=1232801 RepID=A0A6A4XF41_AMPAM|nr:hypothetical protein FJT64_016237 [Amphibalanus amphitrite]